MIRFNATRFTYRFVLMLCVISLISAFSTGGVSIIFKRSRLSNKIVGLSSMGLGCGNLLVQNVWLFNTYSIEVLNIRIQKVLVKYRLGVRSECESKIGKMYDMIIFNTRKPKNINNTPSHTCVCV